MNRNFKTIVAALALLTLQTACKKEDPAPDDALIDTEPTTLDCNSFQSDMVLTDDPDKPVDYIVTCQANVNGALSVQPGVVVHFESNAGLKVVNGSIAIQGTSSEPVVFDGTSSVSGAWAGIYISSNNVNNSINYLSIRNGGGDSFNSNDDRGNIVLYAGGRLSLNNSSLSGSAAFGLNCNYEDMTLSHSSNTYTSNASGPVYITVNKVHELDPQSSYTGNGANYINAGIESIEEVVVWQKLNVPYRITPRDNGLTKDMNIKAGADVTLTQGTIVELEADCSIRVVDGILRADGTSTEKVVLRGVTPSPGAWKGLLIDSNNLNNQLNNVEILHTGSSQVGGYDGAIVIWADAYLSITNSLLSDGTTSCAINAPFPSETLITTGTSFGNFTTDVCQ